MKAEDATEVKYFTGVVIGYKEETKLVVRCPNSCQWSPSVAHTLSNTLWRVGTRFEHRVIPRSVACPACDRPLEAITSPIDDEGYYEIE